MSQTLREQTDAARKIRQLIDDAGTAQKKGIPGVKVRWLQAAATYAVDNYRDLGFRRRLPFVLVRALPVTPLINFMADVLSS